MRHLWKEGGLMECVGGPIDGEERKAPRSPEIAFFQYRNSFGHYRVRNHRGEKVWRWLPCEPGDGDPYPPKEG